MQRAEFDNEMQDDLEINTSQSSSSHSACACKLLDLSLISSHPTKMKKSHAINRIVEKENHVRSLVF